MLRLLKLVIALVAIGMATTGCDSAPEDSVPLENTYWRLVRVDDRNMDATVEEVPYVVFDAAEGTAGGSSGCNLWSADYSIDGDHISLAGVITTLRGCQKGPAEIESKFYDALAEVALWDIDGDELEMRSAGDRFLMRFVADPEIP